MFNALAREKPGDVLQDGYVVCWFSPVSSLPVWNDVGLLHWTWHQAVLHGDGEDVCHDHEQRGPSILETFWEVIWSRGGSSGETLNCILDIPPGDDYVCEAWLAGTSLLTPKKS